MRFLSTALLVLLSISGSAQAKRILTLDLSFGNAWYNFNSDRVNSIFIDPFVNGLHGNNIAQVGLDLSFLQKIGKGFWFSTSLGSSMMKLNYTDRASKDPVTYFSSQELFANLKGGLRFYSNEYRSPSIYIELQPGIGYSYAGGSEKTDYVMGDFYQPGSFVYFYQGAIGAGKFQAFYRAYLERGLAADNIKIVGLKYSFTL